VLLERTCDGLIESGGGILERFAVTDAEARRAGVTELSAALGGELRIPGEERWEREGELEDASDEETVLCGEGVAGEKGIVALVEESEMTGSVARAAEGEESADRGAVIERSCRLCLATHETEQRFTLLVGVEGKIARQETGFTCTNSDFERSRQLRGEGVEGSDVIKMSMSEKNATDRQVESV